MSTEAGILCGTKYSSCEKGKALSLNHFLQALIRYLLVAGTIQLLFCIRDIANFSSAAERVRTHAHATDYCQVTRRMTGPRVRFADDPAGC